MRARSNSSQGNGMFKADEAGWRCRIPEQMQDCGWVVCSCSECRKQPACDWVPPLRGAVSP